MEPEEPPLYIYNPYVLAVLYSKTRFLGLLREYHCACVEPDQAALLISDNVYDCVLVADVVEMTRALTDHEWPLDLYLCCNYEYALYRMLMLCQPPEEQLPLGCTTELGSPFLCDLKCQVLLDRDTHDKTQFRTALRCYLTLQYFTRATLRDYEKVARARTKLLMEVKASGERAEAVRRAPDFDYTVRYNKELHQTMLYLCLLNELLAEVELSGGECEPLLLELHETLRQHYVSEVRDCSGASPRVSMTEDWSHFASYTRTGCVWDRIVEVRTHRNGGFTVPERDTRNLRYLDLRCNRSHYQYAVRRFAFDVEAQRLHLNYCKKVTPCHGCHYRQQRSDEPLVQFYELCETYAYHAPEYDQVNETRLHSYLGQAVLALVPPVDAIMYKNLWQLQRLFALEAPLKLLIPTQRAQPLETDVYSLFQALDLVDMLRDLRLQYGETEGGPEARTIAIVNQHQTRFSKAGDKPRTEAHKLWQMRLAIDTDAVLCIMRALASQHSAVEKCERAIASGHQPGALSPRHDSLKSQHQFFTSLRSAVTRAYTLYVTELQEALKLY